MPRMQKPFWKTTPLAEMTPTEWESLCDGCGKCCLSKLEDEDTADIHWTTVGCRLLDGETCQCKDYQHRKALVADCIQLSAASVPTYGWLPATWHATTRPPRRCAVSGSLRPQRATGPIHRPAFRRWLRLPMARSGWAAMPACSTSVSGSKLSRCTARGH